MNDAWKIAVTTLVGAGIAVSLGANAPNRSVALWLVLAIVVGFAGAFFVRAWKLARPALKTVARRLLRFMRDLRMLPRMSPALRFLHALAWVNVCLMVAALYARQDRMVDACEIVALALLFVAGSVDLIGAGTVLARRVWNEMLGKLFSVSFGAILLYSAISLAKTYLHSIAHIDPKYLTESTAILTAILLPVTYCLFGMALVYLLAAVQLCAIPLTMFASTFLGSIDPLGGAARRERLRLLWYRIVTGKNSRCGPPPPRTVLDRMLAFTRPMSLFAVIGVLAWGFETANEFLPRLRPYATSALVALEYREGSRCIGFEKGVGVVYMEDSNISVVRQTAAGPTFSVETCNFKPERPGG